MTTASSPLKRLKAQADEIASRLKAMERGDGPADDKVRAARLRDSITFGVVMDDKVIKVEMPWATIRANSETGISEWIMKQMREERDS
jgi:hypothetical protein